MILDNFIALWINIFPFGIIEYYMFENLDGLSQLLTLYSYRSNKTNSIPFFCRESIELGNKYP